MVSNIFFSSCLRIRAFYTSFIFSCLTFWFSGRSWVDGVNVLQMYGRANCLILRLKPKQHRHHLVEEKQQRRRSGRRERLRTRRNTPSPWTRPPTIVSSRKLQPSDSSLRASSSSDLKSMAALLESQSDTWRKRGRSSALSTIMDSWSTVRFDP
jgi:hypothetical protein